MLELIIPRRTFFNESTSEFIEFNETKLKLEHSLISISKWESKLKKPFLSDKKHTKSDMLYYIECMSLNPDVDPMVYKTIPDDLYLVITEYIEDSMTATTINDNDSGNNNDIITAEIIYYWMIELGIPFECQKWHFNRLMTLIRVCGIKKGPQKKMSKREILEQNRRLNEARKKQHHTRG